MGLRIGGFFIFIKMVSNFTEKGSKILDCLRDQGSWEVLVNLQEFQNKTVRDLLLYFCTVLHNGDGEQ